ncbi:MAG: hypothetical protein BWK79_16525 [Beggiatoa sp. IS2]|nr:MAG: hypothetical protein BWK79_16525 [Beggiatoa sp. IS2]
MRRFFPLIGFLLLGWLIALPVYAGQTAVLIHGYWSDGSDWRKLGIVQALQLAGWQDAGHALPYGILPAWGYPNATGNFVYTVTLPAEAPLPVQVSWLGTYLQGLHARHPDNDLVLVGHSAGGVVARLAMVVTGAPVRTLVTIASPHLGTDAAELGLEITHSPAGWFLPFLGGNTLLRSEGLYRDLVREYPGTLLFWLNRQSHPEARYISIVRIGVRVGTGDHIVPIYSQDLNYVPALSGKSTTISSIGFHGLQPADGPLLASVLAEQ